MATHSTIHPWRIPWTEEPGELYSPWGRRESDMTERLKTKTNKCDLYTFLDKTSIPAFAVMKL